LAATWNRTTVVVSMLRWRSVSGISGRG
jgi:hypothetical protein